jgi:hypothetical protein
VSGDEQSRRGRSTFCGRVRSWGLGSVTAVQRLQWRRQKCCRHPVLGFPTPLREVIKVLIVLGINHIPNVYGNLPEKQDLYDFVQGVRRLTKLLSLSVSAGFSTMSIDRYLVSPLADTSLKGQCREIFASGFFHQSLTPVANLPPVSTALVKLVAKFSAGVVDTGGQP